MTPPIAVSGEHPSVPECVVLAPASGVFRALATDSGNDGGLVYEGQSIGTVESSGVATPVESRFTGFLMGMLAHHEERVREGQPVAWLRNLGWT